MDKKNNIKKDFVLKGMDDMAALTCPCKAPFIIRDDRSQQFIEKCKKSSVSPEKRKQLIEYYRSSRSDSHDENQR